MIRAITEKDIPACVQVIRRSFQTVADTFGFTPENAPRFTAFATDEARLLYFYAGAAPPDVWIFRGGGTGRVL